MALFEVVLRGSYFGQDTINRWNYVSSGDVGSASPAFGLLYAMGWRLVSGAFPVDSLAGSLQNVLNENFEFASLQCVNVFDPADFSEQFFATAQMGINSGVDLSPTIAIGYVSNQVTRAIPKGHKRFAGLIAADFTDGGEYDPAHVAAFNDVAGYMTNVLTYDLDSASLSYTPAICSKLKYLSHSSPDRYSYKYYVDLATQLEHTAQGVTWTLMPHTRTQTSRQYGRGV
jgi:hypothetical protein